MSEKKLKGVCIGAGYFSHFQYEAWQRIPEVEITGFSNREHARAAEISEKFGLEKCFADYREMFDQEKPDFVDIITPPPTHKEMCAEAAKRGIHIICQKPLAPTLVEAEEIVANATSSNVRFMVHENFRFQPWHRELKKQLESGVIGELFSMSFRSRMGDGWGEDAYIPRQPYFRDYPKLLVYENGVHFIDTFRYLAGDVDRVSAWLRKLNPVIKGEDCGLLVFEFANGAIGNWDANRYNEPDFENPRYTFGEFLIEGSKGSLRLASDGRITLKVLGEPEQGIEYEHRNHAFAGDCCYFTQRHFIDRLIDGKDFETSGDDYLKTLRVQDAVYQSAESRGPVEVAQS